jgi:hypothetical protein
MNAVPLSGGSTPTTPVTSTPGAKIITVTIGAPTYTLNGEVFDADAITYNGTAYLPAAYLATKLGLTARWDSSTNVTALTSGTGIPPASSGSAQATPPNPVTRTISATFGSPVYTLNGVPFDQEAFTYNGTAYLPAAYLATMLGLTAQWDAATNVTRLTSK